MPHSPDFDALVRRQIVLVARLHVERFVPRIDIANGPDALDIRRVPIRDHYLAQIFIAMLDSEELRPAEEEALVAGEAVDHRRRLTAERTLVGIVGDCE